MSSPALLPSLACTVRGLSALFWGLPLALFLSAHLALGLAVPGRAFLVSATRGPTTITLSAILPAVLAHGLILYGLGLMRRFQPQERIWVAALGRARLLGWLGVTLVPFQFWYARSPAEQFFTQSFVLSVFVGIAFLMAVNQVLRRLAAMLPDETLRSDTRLFTAVNLQALFLIGVLLAAALVAASGWWAGSPVGVLLRVVTRLEPWHLVLPALIPLALTMTLTWKTKEVIMASVFRTRP